MSIVRGIKGRLTAYKPMFANLSYLTVLQFFNVLFPLLTYPYLLRVLGIELYGVIAFAQGIMTYISLFVNFGFNMSGIRDVSLHRNDNNLLSQTVSSIYICKSFIWIVCLILYIVLITTLPFFKSHYGVYLLSFLLTLNELLLPVWFFQGIEKMKYVTIVGLVARVVFTFAIFLFVKNREDYILVPALNGTGAFIAGLLSFYIVVKRENVRIVTVSLQVFRNTFKEAFPLFASILSSQIYLSLNRLVVGLTMGMADVAIYDMAEKITSLLKLPASIVSQTVFPRVSRERNIRFLNRVMFLVASGTLLLYLFLFPFGRTVVSLFSGTTIAGADTTIQILAASATIVSFNLFMGGCRLVPLGYSYLYLSVMAGNCLFFFVGTALLWLTGLVNLHAIATLNVLTEVVCLVSLSVICHRACILRARGK